MDILRQIRIGIIPMEASVLLMPMIGGARLMAVHLHMEIEVKDVLPDPEIQGSLNEEH